MDGVHIPPRAVDPSHPKRSSLDFSVGPRMLAFKEVDARWRPNGDGAKALAVATRASDVTAANFIVSQICDATSNEEKLSFVDGLKTK